MQAGTTRPIMVMDRTILAGFAILLFSLVMAVAGTVDANVAPLVAVFVGVVGLIVALVGAFRRPSPGGARLAPRTAPPERLS